HSMQAVFCALLVFTLGACSEQPVSDLTAPAAMEAINSGDAKAWDAVRSKKVRWAGSVLKVQMIHGDEFVKEYFLRFDPGFGAGAVAEVQINPSQAEDFKAGQTITVTGIVLSHEKEKQTVIVKLGSGKVEAAAKK
ncbi:MAG: hypothetical protein HN377_03815, partial [Alphaproteobacteria bacterium]|nr:hypothetical protein [Alphaproteobacteria bacterium]